MKIKIKKTRNGRVLFAEASPNRPIQIPVAQDADLDDLELSDDQIEKLTDAGADPDILALGAKTPEQVRGTIVQFYAGHEGTLEGTKGMTYPVDVKLSDGVVINTVVSLPVGTEPQKHDIVTLNKYAQKGLYFQQAGESTGRDHSLMYVVEPGFSALKATQIRTTTDDELERDRKKALADAAIRQAQGATKATTEA